MTDRAYRHIRAGLAAGHFRPGNQLSEVEIAKEISVGRTPIREAFLLLANEGFIEQLPRYGTFVKKAGYHERQSLYELREVLESYAAGKAAEFMSDNAIAKLESLCDEMLAVARLIRDNNNTPTEEMMSRVAIADVTFHALILRASGNPLVIKMVGDLHLMGRIFGGDRGDPYRKNLRDRAQSWQEHLRVQRAIRHRDAAAASHWMSVHLRHATEMALEYYERQARTQGADAAAHEWPQAVRDAISRIEQSDPEINE